MNIASRQKAHVHSQFQQLPFSFWGIHSSAKGSFSSCCQSSLCWTACGRKIRMTGLLESHAVEQTKLSSATNSRCRNELHLFCSIESAENMQQPSQPSLHSSCSPRTNTELIRFLLELSDTFLWLSCSLIKARSFLVFDGDRQLTCEHEHPTVRNPGSEKKQAIEVACVAELIRAFP